MKIKACCTISLEMRFFVRFALGRIVSEIFQLFSSSKKYLDLGVYLFAYAPRIYGATRQNSSAPEFSTDSLRSFFLMGVSEGVDYVSVISFTIGISEGPKSGHSRRFFRPSGEAVQFSAILTSDMDSPCPKTPVPQIWARSEKLRERVQKKIGRQKPYDFWRFWSKVGFSTG